MNQYIIIPASSPASALHGHSSYVTRNDVTVNSDGNHETIGNDNSRNGNNLHTNSVNDHAQCTGPRTRHGLAVNSELLDKSDDHDDHRADDECRDDGGNSDDNDIYDHS